MMLIGSVADRVARRFMIRYATLTPTVYTQVEPSGVRLTVRYLCEPRRRRSSAQAIWKRCYESSPTTPTSNSHTRRSAFTIGGERVQDPGRTVITTRKADDEGNREQTTLGDVRSQLRVALERMTWTGRPPTSLPVHPADQGRPRLGAPGIRPTPILI